MLIPNACVPVLTKHVTLYNIDAICNNTFTLVACHTKAFPQFNLFEIISLLTFSFVMHAIVLH